MDQYELNVIMRGGRQAKVKSQGASYTAACKAAKESDKKIDKIISGQRLGVQAPAG